MKTLYHRSKYISVVAVVGLTWSMLSFLYVFSPSVKKVGIWFPAVLGVLVASRFISMIGVWHMKKWGVLLFFISALMKLFLAILLNQLSIVEVILTLFLGISFLFFFRKMDDNM
jgi:uncharacterized membrane protein